MLVLKKILFAFFTLFLLTHSLEAIAKRSYNPHHKLTIAMENGVRSLQGGNEAIAQAQEAGLQQLLFHCFVVNDENRLDCQKDYLYDYSNGRIFFHADYHGLSFEELTNLVYEAILGF